MLKAHPKGLMVLFFTEMWERFGYYLLLGIFTLYMIAPQTARFPGLGMSNMEAADIYGTFLALVYLTPFIGGLIADRIIGYRKAIYIGGLLMAAGYIGLAIPDSMLAFYLSLLLIILGNGLFKPNVSVLLGKLYERPEFEHMKDSGYNIFYMGINFGAFILSLIHI
jgi:POT family proton-dependent oligopeptide transporter